MTNRCCNCGKFVSMDKEYYCTPYGTTEDLDPPEEEVWCEDCFKDGDGDKSSYFWTWRRLDTKWKKSPMLF